MTCVIYFQWVSVTICVILIQFIPLNLPDPKEGDDVFVEFYRLSKEIRWNEGISFTEASCTLNYWFVEYTNSKGGLPDSNSVPGMRPIKPIVRRIG